MGGEACFLERGTGVRLVLMKRRRLGIKFENFYILMVILVSFNWDEMGE